ncbi:hypothetical protein ISCGN_021742 [Ixodes scapularis]
MLRPQWTPVSNSAIMFVGLLHAPMERRARSPWLAADPPNPPPRNLDFCESDCHPLQYQQSMSSSSCMYILITLSCSLDAAPRASMGCCLSAVPRLSRAKEMKTKN